MLQRKSGHGDWSTRGHPPKSGSVKGGLAGRRVTQELGVVGEGLHFERHHRIGSGGFAEATEGDRHPEGDGWTAFCQAQPSGDGGPESLMTCGLPVEAFVRRLVRLRLGGGAGCRSLRKRQVNAGGLLPGRLVGLWQSCVIELLWRDVSQRRSVSWKCHIHRITS